MSDIPNYIGRIVCANNNEYLSMGKMTMGVDAIQINEALPVVSLCNKGNDKTCYGVISGIEDATNIRSYEQGSFVSTFDKLTGDTRVHINSLGEGAMWVCNKNGNFESGDYITTSINGYGAKQNDDILHNYTVAKITMDCNFQHSIVSKKEPISTNMIYTTDSDNNIYVNGNMVYKKETKWTHSEYSIEPQDDGSITVKKYSFDEYGNLNWRSTTGSDVDFNTKYIDENGNDLSLNEYIQKVSNNETIYTCAFVGVTYHCG
jgi:hypothetical protein